MKSTLGLAALATILAAPAYAGISIDRASQSIPLCGADPARIYSPISTGGCDVGGPGPQIEVARIAYGLIAGDNTDALSANTLQPKNDRYRLVFSGDQGSAGAPGTPYRAEAVLNQAPSDLWQMVNLPAGDAWNAWLACAPVMIPGGHVMFSNQTAYNLIFTAAPGAGPLAGNDDNLDGVELDDLDPSGDLVHDLGVYFSLDAASPSAASPSDIYFSAPGAAAFATFAADWRLGLNANNNVDALVIWDRTQIGIVDPGVDLALFSLAPGSAALAGPDGVAGTADDFSAADIFVTGFTNTFCLYTRFGQLGMRFQDNVDALDALHPAGGD